MQRTFRLMMATLAANRNALASDGAAPWIVKWTLAAIVSFWGTRTAAVQLLFILCCIDYVTGLATAIKSRRVNSQKSYWGIFKKAGMFILVYVGALISKAWKLDFDLGEAIALGYTINEVISITENLQVMGVPIPRVLVITLLKVKDLVPRGSVREYRDLNPAKLPVEDEDTIGESGDGDGA